MTDSLRDLIQEFGTGDPVESAEAVFDALAVPAKWRETFGQVVRDECRRRYRAGVASSESAPTGHGRHDTHGPNAGGGTTRTDYLALRFAVGHGRYVKWGEATVDDHRERIALLSSLRNGLDNTIDRHAEAITAIEAAGATCLNDIEQVAA